MAQPATAPSVGTTANTPEKPAPVQLNSHAQPPWQQSQFQPVDFPQSGPFRPSKPFSLGKLILGCFNLVFAIIALGLSLGLMSQSYTFDSFIGIVILAVTAAASIVWQLAELITLLARRSIQRPIHPGAHVGVHLILWLLSALVLLSEALSLAYVLAEYTVDPACTSAREYDYYYSSDCGWYAFPSDAAARRYLTLLEAVVAFATLLALAHFVLFVVACVETDRRRKWGRQRTKVVYLVAAHEDDGARLRPYSQHGAAAAAADGHGGMSPPPPPPPVPVRKRPESSSAAAADTAAQAHGYYAPAGAPAAGS